MINQKVYLLVRPMSQEVTHETNLNQFRALPQLLKLSINKPGGRIVDQISRQDTWAEQLLKHIRLKDAGNKEGWLHAIEDESWPTVEDPRIHAGKS